MNERSVSSDKADKAESATRSKSNDKRKRILNAAIKVFAKHGFYATRVSEIAKEAGVADGTIYLYFKNKDDVLLTIFEEGIGRLQKLLQETVDKHPTAEQRLRRIVEIQLGLLEGERELAEVITVNLRQSPTLLREHARPHFTKYLELIAGVVQDGQREGALRNDVNAMVVARALWGGLDGIAITWAYGQADPKALRKAANQFATVFLDGLKPTTA